MSFIFTNQASRHGLSVLLLFPCFFYLSFFLFLSLFDIVVLLPLASLFITALALALSGQPEKAAIFCKGCYAALHGHRSRCNFMFFVHPKYLERFVTFWLITWSLVTNCWSLCVPGQSQSEQWTTLNSQPVRPTPNAEDVKPRFDFDMQTVSEEKWSEPPMIIITIIKCRGCESKVCLPDPDQISSRDHFFTQINSYQFKFYSSPKIFCTD